MSHPDALGVSAGDTGFIEARVPPKRIARHEKVTGVGTVNL
jgi:hypothetical protein